jgi:hypothetical protein
MGGVLHGCGTASDPDAVATEEVQWTEPAETSDRVDRSAQQQAGEEAQDRMFSCLEARGFRVDRAPDGSAEIHAAEGDTDAEQLRRAMQECEEQAGFPELAPLSVAEVEELYKESLDAEQCLISAGYSPPPHPSLEQFVQDYLAMQQSGTASAWFPHDGINDLASAEALCPQPGLGD